MNAYLLPPLMDDINDDIHLWLVPIEQLTGSLSELAELLSEKEKKRGARFVFEKDRHRYTISQATLKIILAHYAQLSPAEIQFTRGIHGKPYLAPEQNKADIQFNMTHAMNYIVIAINKHKEIGVDIESSARKIDINHLGESLFSKAEMVWLNQAPAQQAKNCFLYLWTRKESILKQTGEGLYSEHLTEYTSTPFAIENLSMETFSFPYQPAGGFDLLALSPDIVATNFHIQDETYFVTLCYEGMLKKVVAFNVDSAHHYQRILVKNESSSPGP